MIAELLQQIALEEDRERRKEEPKTYYPRPSLAGEDRCIRQMVYWGLNVPRAEMPGRALMIFDDSSWHEELTADWVRKSSYKLHSQQMEVESPMPMAPGHIDGVLTDLLGVDYLWEHKAINHFTFEKYWEKDDVFPIDYLTQCCIYIWGLKKLNPALNLGCLTIKNKNTAQYIDFLFSYNKETDTIFVYEKIHSTGERKELKFYVVGIVMGAVAKFDQVADYITRKTLPRRPYEQDDWHCSYCGWNEVCWGDYLREFEELKIVDMLPNEVADLIRYKQETTAHRLEMEKEEGELSHKIKDMLRSNNLKGGRAGEYFVELKIEDRKGYIREVKPAKVEKLSITKLKPKKEKKNGN